MSTLNSNTPHQGHIDSLAHFLLLKHKAQGGLPSSFKRLNYLESTGTQWIDTGVLLLPLDFKFEITVGGNSLGASIVHNYDAGGTWVGICDNRMFYSGWQNNGTLMSFSDGDVISYDAGSEVRINGTLVKKIKATHGNESGINLMTLPLFGWYDFYHSQVTSVSSIIKNAVISRDSTALRSFIPARCPAGYRYKDGNTGLKVIAEYDKPGMYDLVSKSFFINQGTGEFLYG